MRLSDDAIKEFKDIYKEKNQKELSDAEASEAAHGLVGLVEIFWKMAQKDGVRKRRLEKEPDGFPVDGHYSCLVCGQSIDETNGWYDWYGQTCLLCRKAIQNGIIPTFVCTEYDSYFKTWQFEKFGLKSPTVRKMVRNDELKARIVLDENGKPHEYIFLKKENPRYREFHNATYKSCQRNRHKMSDAWGRKMKIEMREEREKLFKRRPRAK